MCRHFDQHVRSKAFIRAVYAVAVAISAIFCPVASAGTYLMNTCNVPGRAAATLAPWYWEAAANVAPVDSCARGGGFVFYLGGDVSIPRGAATALTMSLPANGPISIRRVRLWAVARLAGTGSALFVGTNSGAPDGQVTNSDLFGPPGGETLASPHVTPLLPIGTNVFRVLLYCSQSSPDYCYPTSRSPLEVIGAEVTLLESVAPSVTVPGGALVSGGPQSGKRILRYNATDDQSGIELIEVLIDGAVAVRRDFGPECPRSDYAACPKAKAEELTFDTGTLTNGTHRLRVRATDAAGNTTESAGQTVEVSNQLVAGNQLVATPATDAPPLRGGRVTASFAATSKRIVTVSYGSRPKVIGRLIDADGSPVARASIAVVEKVAGRPASIIPVGQTGLDGKYVFRLARRGGSRTVFVRYQAGGGGDALESPALRLRVRAAASLKVALNGVRVRYRGKVLSQVIPRRGVVVVMQGRRRGGTWQSFASRTVRRPGRFTGTYRLRVRRPGVALQFRAVIAKAPGYPYEAGVSATITRRVR